MKLCEVPGVLKSKVLTFLQQFPDVRHMQSVQLICRYLEKLLRSQEHSHYLSPSESSNSHSSPLYTFLELLFLRCAVVVGNHSALETAMEYRGRIPPNENEHTEMFPVKRLRSWCSATFPCSL